MIPNQQQPVPITYQYNCYPQTPFSFPLASDSVIQPPGTNPLVNSTLPSIYSLGTTDYGNWIVKNAEPVVYGHAIGPSHENHISRKKHQGNLQLLAKSTDNTLLAELSNTNSQTNSDSQGKVAVGPTTNFKRFCTICNVVCTSLDVYEKHVAGKKHTAKVALIFNNGLRTNIAACKRYGLGFRPTALKKIKVDQSACCEVCQVKCNSKDMYIAHLAGKKHLKNTEKQLKQKIDASAGTTTGNTSQPSTNVIIGPQEKPSTDKIESQKTPEADIEMKKLKLVQGGAAEANVKICIPCNVVCNSQTVYETHLAGHKHNAMLKKQKEATGV